MAGHYGFMLEVHVSIPASYVLRPTVFCVWMITWVTSCQQWIFTKFGLCFDIVEIWFGIANGQISSNFDRVICLRHIHIIVYGW